MSDLIDESDDVSRADDRARLASPDSKERRTPPTDQDVAEIESSGFQSAHAPQVMADIDTPQFQNTDQRKETGPEHRQPTRVAPDGKRAAQRALIKTRLLIHAGVHRTGTTAVQEALFDNRSTLAAHGVIYPTDFTSQHGGNAAHWSNHLNLAFALKRKQVDPGEVTEWLTDIAASGGDLIVLSAEDFCTLDDISFARPLLDHFSVQIVFYLRRQDDWINSWYNQHIRWPFDETLSNTTPLEFLNYIDRFHWLRYFDMLERWANILGRENISVRIFEDGQVSDVVTDLFTLCNAPTPPIPYRRNESASAEHLELLRRIRMIRHTPKARIAILDALARLPATGGSNVFPAAIRRLLLQRYAIQNQKVARVYLGRVNGVLFRNTAFPDDSPSLDGTRPLDETLMLQFIESLLLQGGDSGPPVQAQD